MVSHGTRTDTTSGSSAGSAASNATAPNGNQIASLLTGNTPDGKPETKTTTMPDFNHQKDESAAALPIIKAILVLIAIVGLGSLLAYLT